MDRFVIGVLVGAALFTLIYSVVTLSKMYTNLLLLQQNVDAQAKALQLVFMKINKIERTTESTMNAAETFVDALRESAENIQLMGMQSPKLRGPMSTEGFDDLRKSFEDGVKGMEDEVDDSDEDSDEPQEPWK